MTKRKKASTIGKAMRQFDKVVGGASQRMYQGESPAPPDKRALRRMAVRAAKIAAKLDVEMRIFLEAYKTHKTYAAAYLSLHPDYTGKSATTLGWREMEKIRKVIPETEIAAMLGLSAEAVISAIGRGLVSRAKKDFVLPRSGQIISTESYDDTANQLAAASLAAKILKMVPDDKPGVGPVTVNIVSYLGGPVAEQKPWVGGGRIGADGVMRPTVGPESYAALAARGAIRPALPAGTLGEGKNND